MNTEQAKQPAYLQDTNALGVHIVECITGTAKTLAERAQRRGEQTALETGREIEGLQDRIDRAMWDGQSFVPVHFVENSDLNFSDRDDLIELHVVAAALQHTDAEIYRRLQAAAESSELNLFRVDIRWSRKADKYVIGLVLSGV